ncbi:uncharacterized protein [Procambarus clarkii]
MTALGNVSALSAAVLYGVLSLSMAFLNKAVISQYKFNFPFFILSCQMMLTLIILEVMRALGKFGLPSITMAAVKMFAFPAFCYSLHAILSLVALAGMGDPSFNGFAYMFGGVSVVLQAVYQTLVQQCGENKLSPLHVLHLNSCISLVPFVILTFGKGELKAVLTYQYIGDRSFHLIFITLLVMGLLLNFSMFLCTMLNSALTTSIVGVSKSVLQTFIGFFTFGGVIFDAVNIAGIALNTCGGVLYTYAKYEDQKTRWRKIDLGDTGIQQAGWELKEKLMPVS